MNIFGHYWETTIIQIESLNFKEQTDLWVETMI